MPTFFENAINFRNKIIVILATKLPCGCAIVSTQLVNNLAVEVICGNVSNSFSKAYNKQHRATKPILLLCLLCALSYNCICKKLKIETRIIRYTVR